jgi:cytochrome c peroxidase
LHRLFGVGLWRSKVKAQHAPLSMAVAVVAVTVGADAPSAEERSAMFSAEAMQGSAQVEAEIDPIEARAMRD